MNTPDCPICLGRMKYEEVTEDSAMFVCECGRAYPFLKNDEKEAVRRLNDIVEKFMFPCIHLHE